MGSFETCIKESAAKQSDFVYFCATSMSSIPSIYVQHTRGDQVWFPEILGRKVLEKFERGSSLYLTTDS